MQDVPDHRARWRRDHPDSARCSGQGALGLLGEQAFLLQLSFQGLEGSAEATFTSHFQRVRDELELAAGLVEPEATAHLNEINRIGGPWQLSFSYGRALQQPALKAWGGKAENKSAAQQAFFRRAKMNGAARSGDYDDAMEQAA